MNEQQRTAMELALEALEAHADIGIKSDKAITALKEALAYKEPEQDPVAWNDENVIAYCLKRGIEAAKHVAPQRKPLTDEQIDALYEQHVANCWDSIEDQRDDPVRIMARAIEAAHGIKE